MGEAPKDREPQKKPLKGAPFWGRKKGFENFGEKPQDKMVWGQFYRGFLTLTLFAGKKWKKGKTPGLWGPPWQEGGPRDLDKEFIPTF